MEDKRKLLGDFPTELQLLEVHNNDRLVLVNLNKSYDQIKAEGVYKRSDLYEAARKYWHLNKKRADKADYLLGVYKGVVVIVIKPTGEWQPVDLADNGEKFPNARYQIEGEVMEETPYMGKSTINYPFGSGGAVTYIPRDISKWE